MNANCGTNKEFPMVVQIDIDGTIDAAPEFFRWLSVALKRDGHRDRKSVV